MGAVVLVLAFLSPGLTRWGSGNVLHDLQGKFGRRHATPIIERFEGQDHVKIIALDAGNLGAEGEGVERGGVVIGGGQHPFIVAQQVVAIGDDIGMKVHAAARPFAAQTAEQVGKGSTGNNGSGLHQKTSVVVFRLGG